MKPGRIILVACMTIGCLVPLESQADVQVRGYTRSDGTYVRPHVRSDPDGIFANNWSTRGNVNPYTGMPGTKTRPSRSGYSAPSRGYYDSAPYVAPYVPSAEEQAAIAAAQERVRAEALLAAERERVQSLRLQARRAVETKINADSQARWGKWREAEARIESDERARLDATMAERWREWLVNEAQAKQSAASQLQQELADYSRRWDNADLLLEVRQRSERFDATGRVAEAHAIVNAMYAGDGQQARRDAQRRRADAWANAARDVKEKRLAQYQRDARAAGEADYQAAAYARLQAAEHERLMAWAKQQTEFRLAAETAIKQDASERLATFQRQEATLIAQARADAEQVLLSLEESWSHGPGTTSASDSREDQPAPSQSLPSSAPAGLLLTAVAAAAGLFRVLKS